jgi:hypothetical protein
MTNGSTLECAITAVLASEGMRDMSRPARQLDDCRDAAKVDAGAKEISG